MRRGFALVALVLLALLAGQRPGHAQGTGVDLYCQNSQGTFVPVSPTNPCPFTGSSGTITATPPAITGYGALTVGASSSTLLSTVTTSPDSAAWPTSPGYVVFWNTGSATAYYCPLGGPCSAAVGLPVPAGGSYGAYKISTNATAFSVGATAVTLQW